MAETVTVDGDENLRRTMHSAEQDMEHMDMSPAARVVQARARARAPKRTGTLAGSITARDLGTGVAVVSSSLVYAPVQNYGWPRHNITARHFMESALVDSRDLVVADAKRETDKALAQVRGA